MIGRRSRASAMSSGASHPVRVSVCSVTLLLHGCGRHSMLPSGPTLPSTRRCDHDGGRPTRGKHVATIDTGTEDLLADVEDGVAVLTMNRPERRNAMSGPMLEAMARLLADVEVDDDVGCVVLTGAGGAFCAGGDVKGMAGEDGRGSGEPVPYDAVVHR